MLTVSSGDVIPQLPTKEMLSAGKHLMLMTLLENYDGKHIEMVSWNFEDSLTLPDFPNFLNF